MPLTLTVTEGVLPPGSEQATFVRLSDAMLEWTGAAGNAFLTPLVVGSINVVPRGRTFSGSIEAAVAFVEWKVPSFVFVDRDVQRGYIEEATDIVHEMSGGTQPREQIWVNVVHAVDGSWGVAGNAMTNDQLAEAAANG
jgi:hypothetical protein